MLFVGNLSLTAGGRILVKSPSPSSDSESLEPLPEASPGAWVFPVWPPSQVGYLIMEGRCFFQSCHRYPHLLHVRHCFFCRVVNHCSLIVKHPRSGREWCLKPYISFLQQNVCLWILPPFPQQLGCTVMVQMYSFSLEVKSLLLPDYFKWPPPSFCSLRTWPRLIWWGFSRRFRGECPVCSLY